MILVCSIRKKLDI